MVVVICGSERGARRAAAAPGPAPRQRAFVPNRAVVFAGSVAVRAAPGEGIGSLGNGWNLLYEEGKRKELWLLKRGCLSGNVVAKDTEVSQKENGRLIGLSTLWCPGVETGQTFRCCHRI